MGFGAIAGIAAGVGSLASAGVGIAGALSAKSPNLGEYSSTLNKLAQQYITPFANNPAFFDINVPGLADQSLSFGINKAPEINAANMMQLQSLLNQALPGYQGMIGQMTTNTQQMLQGILPTDVEQAIQRGSAYSNMVTGIGAGGPGAMETIGARTARNIGLTSLDLTEKGFTQGTNLLQLARNYLMPQPVDPRTLLPLDELVKGTEWTKSNIYTANYNAFSAEAAAAAARVGAPPPSQLAGIGGALQGLNQSFLMQDPKTGQSGFSNLLSSLGGGGQTGSGIVDQFVAGMGLGGAGGAANFGY